MFSSQSRREDAVQWSPSYFDQTVNGLLLADARPKFHLATFSCFFGSFFNQEDNFLRNTTIDHKMSPSNVINTVDIGCHTSMSVGTLAENEKYIASAVFRRTTLQAGAPVRTMYMQYTTNHQRA